MPNYQVITKTDFAHQRWKRHSSYQFAASDAVVPLVAQELSKACLTLPIAFIKQDDHYITAAVQGLQLGQNLFVNEDGYWNGPYTPAAYRGYPFILATSENNQLVLCVATDSGLVGEQFEQPFFDEQGEPAQIIKEILDFLQQVRNSSQLTQRLCDALEAEGLIQPWIITLKSDDGEQTIEGLYRIDEAKFNALPADALSRVHQSGALPIVYCQLLSMQHLQTLGQLAQAHAKVKPEDIDLDKFFGENDDILKFN